MASFKENLQRRLSAVYETAFWEFKSWQKFVSEMWPLLLLLLAALCLAIWFAKPAPPRLVLMASGVGGSYRALAQKYVEYFQEHGVTLKIVQTHGAQENLARLKDRKDPVQVAFVQGGLLRPGDTAGILSLGSVEYEPVWFFYRGATIAENDENIHRLKKMRIAIGSEGSGTHTQAMHILKLNGVLPASTLLTMPNHEGVQALKRGEIDAVFLADGLESANVQALIRDPEIHLANFQRADAYTRMLPFLEVLKIPKGGFDLVRNFPPRDIQLLATTTELLIDDRMHPAIQMLFMQAAQEINGKESYFADRGEFPSFKDPLIPESKVAVHFHKDGPPFLMHYLPFWLAEFIDRTFFMLLPFFAFAYPFVRVLARYRFKRVKTRINQVYAELKSFEQELSQSYDPARHDEYIQRLNAMERETLEMKFPKSPANDYYGLRTNIEFVRSSLNRETPYIAGANSQNGQ